MTIQHLVIGGGGPFGFTAFGVLKHLHDVGFWNIKNIKTIYATSIGALVGAFYYWVMIIVIYMTTL